MDSAGLGPPIGTVRRLGESGANAMVCAARPSVSRVFEIVGLRQAVRIAHSLDDAQTYSW